MPDNVKRRGHSHRPPNAVPSARPSTNDNPVAAQAGVHDPSGMDTSQHLALAFGALSTVDSSSSLQPGTWAADLAFLISDDDAATTYLESADLDKLNKDFSISAYLSAAGVGQVAPNVILHKGQPIDGALLVCLAMNEECRKKGNAAFYHLPSRRNEEVGHAADLVFMRKSWNREDRYGWDNSGWLQRLDMYGVDGSCYDKIDRSALVIPICSRILKFEAPLREPHPHPMAAEDPHNEVRGNPSPTYSSDPAVLENVYRYSRPLQDLSTYLILYPSISTPPLVCPTNVFEDKANSDRHPTPNDISETFTLRVKGPGVTGTAAESWKHHGKVAKAVYEASRKRYLAAGRPMSTNAEVVECLLRACNDEALGLHEREKTESGDMVRYSWQELMNVMDAGLKIGDLMATWPKG